MKKFTRIYCLCIMIVVSAFLLCSCEVSDTINSVKDNNKLPNSGNIVQTSVNGSFGDFVTGNGISLKILTSDTQSHGYGTSVTKELENMRQSVVEIYATLNNATSAGAGVIVSYDSQNKICYIVSCHHVIEGAYDVKMKTLSGDTYSCYLIGSSPDDDVCVIAAVVDKDVVCAKIGNSDNLAVGDEVYAIGNPTGVLGGTVTKGIISALSREIEVEGKEMELLQTDAAINSGNSGGGLFTVDGSLIGIVNAGVNGYEGLNFAIPSKAVKDIATELTSTYKDEKYNSYGYIEGKFNLECTVADSSTSFMSSNRYVIITGLDVESCMYTAGLRVGDRIDSIKIRNESTLTVTSASMLVDAVNNADLKVGDVIIFYISRNRTTYQVTVEIEQYIYGR